MRTFDQPAIKPVTLGAGFSFRSTVPFVQSEQQDAEPVSPTLTLLMSPNQVRASGDLTPASALHPNLTLKLLEVPSVSAVTTSKHADLQPKREKPKLTLNRVMPKLYDCNAKLDQELNKDEPWHNRHPRIPVQQTPKKQAAKDLVSTMWTLTNELSAHLAPIDKANLYNYDQVKLTPVAALADVHKATHVFV